MSLIQYIVDLLIEMMVYLQLLVDKERGEELVSCGVNMRVIIRDRWSEKVWLLQEDLDLSKTNPNLLCVVGWAVQIHLAGHYHARTLL